MTKDKHMYTGQRVVARTAQAAYSSAQSVLVTINMFVCTVKLGWVGGYRVVDLFL